MPTTLPIVETSTGTPSGDGLGCHAGASQLEAAARAAGRSFSAFYSLRKTNKGFAEADAEAPKA